MFTNIPKRQIAIAIIIIVTFYIVSFGLIIYSTYFTIVPFLDKMVGVFMGAGAIAIITGFILIFQSSLQSVQVKKQKVFDKKMDLYQSIIKEMKEKFKVLKGEENPKISPEERRELFFTQLNMALLSKPKTFRRYSEMLNNISDEDGNITGDAYKNLLEFIEEAREDLDVQEPMTPQDKTNFTAALEIAEKEAEQAAKPYQRTMYSDYKEWKYIQEDNAPKTNEGKENTLRALTIVEIIHNKVKQYFENKDDFEMKYSKTGGCTGYAKGKKFLAIGIKSKGFTHVELLKDYQNDYRIPNIDNLITEHIREYDPNKAAPFCEQFRIRSDSLNIYQDNIGIILKLVIRSFELATIHKNKILLEGNVMSKKKYLDPNYRYEYQGE